mgnify:CR=1 FL=1
MIHYNLKVKIVSITPTYVTILLLSSRSKMRMKTFMFVKRVEEGIYEPSNPELLEGVKVKEEQK